MGSESPATPRSWCVGALPACPQLANSGLSAEVRGSSEVCDPVILPGRPVHSCLSPTITL